MSIEQAAIKSPQNVFNALRCSFNREVLGRLNLDIAESTLRARDSITAINEAFGRSLYGLPDGKDVVSGYRDNLKTALPSIRQHLEGAFLLCIRDLGLTPEQGEKLRADIQTGREAKTQNILTFLKEKGYKDIVDITLRGRRSRLLAAYHADLAINKLEATEIACTRLNDNLKQNGERLGTLKAQSTEGRDPAVTPRINRSITVILNEALDQSSIIDAASKLSSYLGNLCHAQGREFQESSR